MEHNCTVAKRGHVVEADRKELEAFEMWCYRRMMKIPNRQDQQQRGRKNEQGKEYIECDKEYEIRNMRDKMIGHLLRHEGLVRDILIQAEMGIMRDRLGLQLRLDYCSQIIRDMGYSIFRKMLGWFKIENQGKNGDTCLISFRTEDSMIMIDFKYMYNT